MTSQPALVAIAALMVLSPAAAQRAGTIEAGAFTGYSDLDNSLAPRNAPRFGARLAFYLRPSLALKADLSRASSDVPGSGTVTHTPVHARLIYSKPAAPRWVALVGGGYVHNTYGDARDASDGGVSALVGLRYHVKNQLWVRLDADADFMFNPANGGPTVPLNGNWGLNLGVTVLLRSRPGEPRAEARSAQDAISTGAETGAVTTIIPTEADARVARVEDLLRGRVPGLEVIPSGDGNYSLRIRGQQTLMGGAAPEVLLVVDGMTVPAGSVGSTLAGLAPRDIARIEVLRDAAATGIYGSRGASGVIIITTKRAND
ncbi:MAG TPA: TonB-dependent receptor plug domain-containing protein [Gemmatimonadales bacterium]|nr:TonB-dependent receptor plug domain-containing protein [Gemmatimonadales bacterium]